MNHTTLWKTSSTFHNSTLSTLLSTAKVTNNSQTNYSIEDLKTAEKCLWKVFSIVFLLFGLTGNFLTILVFRKIGISKRTTLCLLSALAITDSVILVTGLSRYWILYTFELDIRTLSDFGCKIYLFIIYFSMHYSSWILVFVCIERVIKTYLPLRYVRIVTYRRVYMSLIILYVVLSGVDLHFFWTNGINNNTNEDCDSLTPEYNYFNEFVFVYIDFTFLSAAPFVIMLICNVLLVRALGRIQRGRASMMHNVVLRRTQRVSAKLTKMLLVSTFYFLVATVPVSVYFIVDSYRRRQYKVEHDEHGIAVLDLVKAITYLMQYSNYSINFYMYSMANNNFWKKLKIICGCRKAIQRSKISVYTMGSRTSTPNSSSRTRTTEAESVTVVEADFNSAGFETLASSSGTENAME
ncbi:hypothetical protein CHS0354_014879 [Potamilus streckersoni]|uniref:G-protein coupled receptors family 1 profile domain-containing protein n=1 Tax=Potamilus streckersoni TaxID=2493646 RepID=A0AAE0TIQ1_9BIVA|nr:hypothetical protein CHS0354_014879 [Potamilus streckersoni]